MIDSPPPPEWLIYRLCMVALAGASRVVPADRRFDWRREWEAEVWHRVQSLGQRGALSTARQADLLFRCIGACRHAAWLRGRTAFGSASSALRELGAVPAWGAGVTLTLALAMGAGGAVFGAAWAALNRTGPEIPDERVVRIWNRVPGAEMDRTALSALEFARFHAENTTFDQVAAFRRASMKIDGRQNLAPVRGAFVTRDFFHVLGHDFAPGAVLGYDLWRQRFGGDRSVVGRDIAIGGVAYRVAAIAPPDFRFPKGQTELWLPLAPSAASPGSRDLVVIGHLRPGVSRASAAHDLTRLSSGLQRSLPEVYFGRFGTRWQVVVDPLSRPGLGFEPLLFVLLAASILSVLTALATACSLAAARALDGRRSVDFGAAIFCVACAAVLAVVLCESALELAGTIVEAWMPTLGELRVGVPELAFIALTAAAALGGMVVAKRRSDAGHSAFRPILLGTAVATAVVLFAGGTAFGRSYLHMRADGAGFRDAGVVAVPSTGDPGQMRGWRDRMASTPGIESAALATSLPYVDGMVTTSFDRAGVDDPTAAWGPATSAAIQMVDPEYFSVMGIAPRAGRWLRPDRPEAVVSASMARRFWPRGDVMGRRIMVYLTSGAAPVGVTIVGVAGDVRRSGLGGAGIAELYLPLVLNSGGAPGLVVRTSLPANRIAVLLDGSARARPVALSERVRGAMAPHRSASLALCSLAVLAALSAAFATYRGERNASAAGALLGALAGVVVVWEIAPLVSDLLYRSTMRDHLLLLMAVLAAGGSPLAAAFLPTRRTSIRSPVKIC